MLYIHVIETYLDGCPFKSMIVDDPNYYDMARNISLEEVDNVVIVNKVRKKGKQYQFKLLHVFLNGNVGLDVPHLSKRK